MHAHAVGKLCYVCCHCRRQLVLTVDETTVIAISRTCTCAYMHAYVRQFGCVRAYIDKTRAHTHARTCSWQIVLCLLSLPSPTGVDS